MLFENRQVRVNHIEISVGIRIIESLAVGARISKRQAMATNDT